MFALFVQYQGEYNTSIKLVGFTRSKTVAESWNASFNLREEACAKADNYEGWGVYFPWRTATVKELPDNQPLLLERTVWREHDGNGDLEKVDVVTYEEYVANQRSLRRQIEQDSRGYREGRYGEYSLDAHSMVLTPEGLSYGNHKGGEGSLRLMNRIQVKGNGFGLAPV